MKSVYTFRADKQNLQISFELDSETQGDSARDEEATDFLSKILNHDEIDVNGFY